MNFVFRYLLSLAPTNAALAAVLLACSVGHAETTHSRLTPERRARVMTAMELLTQALRRHAWETSSPGLRRSLDGPDTQAPRPDDSPDLRASGRQSFRPPMSLSEHPMGLLQAVTVAATLQTVMAVRENEQNRHLLELARGGSTPQQEDAGLISVFTQSAGHVLNDPTFWAGLEGSVIAGIASQGALWSARDVISKIPGGLQSVVGHGAPMLSATLGWELGAQLFTEAMYLENGPIENRLDESELQYALTHMTMTRYLSSRPRQWPITTANCNRDCRIAYKIQRNIFTILLGRPDLVSNWFYNTYRLRLNNSYFVAANVMGTVGAMAGTAAANRVIRRQLERRALHGAVQAGSRAFWSPVGHFGLRFLFAAIGGVVGGLSALSLPAEFMEDQTTNMNEGRHSSARHREQSAFQRLQERLRTRDLTPEQELSLVRTSLQDMNRFRDNGHTVLIERGYRLATQSVALRKQIELYSNARQEVESSNQETGALFPTQLPPEVAGLHSRWLQRRREQDANINRWIEDTDLSSQRVEQLTGFRGRALRPETRDRLQRELETLALVRDLGVELFATFEESLSARDPSPEMRSVFLAMQQLYMRGFRSTALAGAGGQP